MHRLHSFLVPAVLIGLPGFAAAQIAPVAPFEGVRTEGFEEQQHSGFRDCVAGGVFEGTAELCTPLGTGASLSAGWSLLCTVEERSGARFFGSADGYAELTFDEPVLRFGAWLATPGDDTSVTLRFYDKGGALVGMTSLPLAAGCSWDWVGFETLGAGITMIQIENAHYDGGLVMMDDLQADPYSKIGTSYCAGAPNSTGWTTTISASGSTSISSGELTLRARPVPAGQPGLFFYGGERILRPFGNGYRCVGGGTARVQRLPWALADAAGIMQHTLDLSGSSLEPGSTWYFQVWYTDPAAGGAAFNASDGLRLTFAP